MFGKGIDIKKALNAYVSGNTEISFDGISTDSRTIQEKEVFLALKGPRFDGHNFIDSLKGKTKGFIVNKDFYLEGNKDFFVVKVPDTLKAYVQLANYWRKKNKPKSYWNNRKFRKNNYKGANSRNIIKTDKSSKNL